MKRFLLCLTAAGLLFSCKPKTLIEEYKPIVQGVWVKKQYLDSVIFTKAPASVPQNDNEVIILYIDTKDIKGDSLTFYVGKANHAFVAAGLYFRPGKDPRRIKIADSEVDYTINGKDTLLNIHFERGGKPQVISYIKVAQTREKQKIGEGLDYALNKELFAGKYELKDGSGVKEVEFTVDGKVTGLGKLKTYYVNNDFVIGGHNVDGLTFDMADSTKTSGLAFKIKGDTLDLYNTSVDTVKQTTTIADIKYHLVRKKK
ncbi:hypothetical protein [Mucilaginibacter myungsuensis]|uniref:Lipoprotein n=1 Tax=Mucilaginibacter myungsuensis TaxID=649104 RepID=A0A929KWM7_9SPHI|nr:hypothetical protein [Mucilaginibacter myungsuensis]MBE9662532.1 hypothetical protein [Mucilaginibacter myungsuensis]MDN3597951.1 hypothetical protein [Mucilaginibacter myungsuensis]